MSESDKTNELDSFGVWVKKPPRTVSSDETFENLSSENIAAESGDSKMEDIDIDSFLDGAGFSDGSENETQSQPEEKKSSSDGTEEVSLDEFLDGGIFESDDGGSAASEKYEQESKAETKSEEAAQFSAESFSSPDDVTVSDSVQSSSAADDSPLDIDLSFDDAPLSTAPQNSSDPQFEAVDSYSFDSPASQDEKSESSNGTESVDLSEFGFDIDAPESSSDEKPAESTQQESHAENTDVTESVDLSEFGFDIDAPESSSDEKPAESTQQESHAENTDGTESVDLSEFGFDIDAPESSSDEKPAENIQEASEEPQQAETQADEIPLDISSSSNEISDLDSLSLESSPDAKVLEEPAETKSSGKNDDDFEIDLPLNSENAADDNLNLADFTSDEIPDSFDEETASLFEDEPQENSANQETDTEKTLAEQVQADIVEQSEPVFEETSIDLSELPDEIPEIEDSVQKTEETSAENQNSDLQKEDSNPFALPPDNAFAPLDKQKTENQNADFASEPNLDAAPEKTSEEVSRETSKTPESAENKISEATQGKDEEIASSTNAILSQIVSELASLKSEISGLKTEFNEIKAKGEEVHENKISIPENEQNKGDSGFFSGSEEDDTISLSSDELDNILNTAEMIDEDSSKDSVSESSDFLEPEVNPKDFEQTENTPVQEENALEETISSQENGDFLPDFTDDEQKEDDIFVPKAEEISEAQSQIDFGNLDESEAENSSDSNSEKEDDFSITDSQDKISDELSIGDFSFEDENKPESSETSENQNEELVSDETFAPADFNSMNFSDSAPSLSNENDAEKSEENQNEKTVDEPFEFGSADDFSESSAEKSEIPEINDIEPAQDEGSVAISNEELDHLLAQDSLTDENLNYLASDKEIAGTENSENLQEDSSSIPGNLKKEIKSVLSYMDQLLQNLPEDKIAEFAQSEQFETYKKLFKELGLDN